MTSDGSSVLAPLNLTLTMATVVMWGSAFPFIKVALEELPPITLAALRFALASAFFLSLLFTVGGGMRAVRAITRRQWAMLAAFGLLQSALSNIAQNIGMQWTTSGLASIIQSVGPIFAVTFAILFLQERYTHLKLAGGVLAIAGTVGIVTGGGAQLGGSTFVGNALMIVTALAYASGGTIAKLLLRDMEPITVIALGTPFSVIPLAAWAALEPGSGAAVMGASAMAWGSVLYLALLGTGVSMVMWYFVLKRVELSLLSYFVFLIPVVSVVLAWAWLGETVTPLQVAFAAMIIMGVAVAQRSQPTAAAAVMGAPALEGPASEKGPPPGPR